MSTTGKRSVGWLHPRLMPAMLRPIKPGREAYADNSVAMWGMIGSPGFPRHEDRTRELAGETFDRGVSASGALRQMMAILTQPQPVTGPATAPDADAGRARRWPTGWCTSRVVVPRPRRSPAPSSC